VNEFAHFCATDFMQESTVEIEQFAANCEAVRDLTACEIDVYDHFLYGRYALVRGQLLSSKL
jgi:hypothetical protein